MNFNYKQIAMYLLIAVGLFLLVAPHDTLFAYTPEAIKSMDNTTLRIVGVAFLGGAYYLYYIQNQAKKLTFSGLPSYDAKSSDF